MATPLSATEQAGPLNLRSSDAKYHHQHLLQRYERGASDYDIPMQLGHCNQREKRSHDPMTVSKQVSRRTRHISRVRVVATALSWLALLHCGNERARAGSLVVEVVPSQIDVGVPPGFSGTLELDLLNPASNTQSFQVAGFQFQLLAPAGSGVSFTNATTATAVAPYIFSGDSVADRDFGGSLIISPPPPPPTNDLLGFDTVATPGAFTTLKPGATYGLGLISFSVDASATSNTVPIQIIPFSSTDPYGTQISDPNGRALPFVTSDGLITVHAAAIPSRRQSSWHSQEWL